MKHHPQQQAARTLAMRALIPLIPLLCAASASVQAASVSDFTGPFEIANWTTILDGGSVDSSGAPLSIVFTSSDLGTGPSSQDLTIVSPWDGIVSFLWSYDTLDGASAFDPFGFLVNGAFTQVTIDTDPLTQSGQATFAVSAGDLFGFSAFSYDSSFGAATSTVSALSFTEVIRSVPEPGSMALIGLGLAAFAGVLRGKRSALPA